MVSYIASYKEQLAEDVLKGFSAENKFLKSTYFYDEAGDALFRKITTLPEYYLTRSEREILQEQGIFILDQLYHTSDLNVVELGSGDGTKAQLLFDRFSKMKTLYGKTTRINYYPVDVSENSLTFAEANNRLLANVFPLRDDYFSVLGQSRIKNLKNKLVLFLGSNIGNFAEKETEKFMQYLSGSLAKGEHVLIGFDLVKDAEIVLAAYNDSAGITRDFNLNLIKILNRELDGDMLLDNFIHAPEYDDLQKAAKSFLVATKSHDVYFKKLNTKFSFKEGEKIFTEISCKYSMDDISHIANQSGFEISGFYTDRKKFFADVLLRKK